MFDKVEIVVKAGDGGDGAVSFRREAHVPRGGPDGGDGGNGGSVIIEADPAITSLKMFIRGRLYQAGRGEDGKAKRQHGKNGPDLIIKAPPGTIVLDAEQPDETTPLADCQLPGERTALVKGGRGGKGNVHYVSSTNQTPRLAQKGEAGAGLSIILELRLIADVGIIGYPNAGKSTLLSSVSAAKPKIAPYPFTTLEPALGVVDVGLKRFVIAEIPGLVEGAHLGRGLGLDFLRHAVRTRVFVHLLDGSCETPLNDMAMVNAELAQYDPALAGKPQLVAVNKIDLPEVQAKLPELKEMFELAGIEASFVSAQRGDGLKALMAETAELLERVEAETPRAEPEGKVVFRPRPRQRPGVRKEDGVFVIDSPELERIVARVLPQDGRTSDAEVRRQLQQRLFRMGLKRALGLAGVKPGDKVRCGNYTWEW